MSKEKSCLVTTGLLDTVNWFSTAPDVVIKSDKGGDGKQTWKEKAKQDLIDMLSRTERPFPEAAKRGVEFEKMVYKHANDTDEELLKYSDKFRAVCGEVKGFQFYKKNGINVEVDGQKVYLYGKFDAINLPIIKDIKTTESYQYQKYLSGVQHLLYCIISRATEFHYVVCEWKAYPEIKNIYKESFFVKDFDALEKELFEKISQSFNIFKENDMWNLYRDSFCLY